VEQALASMKAGGKRIVTVPPALGFGERGFTLRPTEHVPGKGGAIPPRATLEYELELLRVSIPPS
jgi:FKBP-type peptidyl-prolyl cis-trans isomerase